MCQAPGHLKWDAMDEMVPRVRAFGWHPIVQFDGTEFPEHEAQLKRIQGDYVIDHIGKFLAPVTPDHDAFKALLRLLDRGNCYIKLSAPYESSRSGPPDYADVTALAKAIAKAAPDRLLWASNWPHPGREHYPSDTDMLDLMLDWVPDEKIRHKMFVENPARLYGF
jgi:D-galactarolactone isomerase